MMKLDKKQIIELLERVPMRKNISAWDRGVKKYSEELIHKLPDDYYFYVDKQEDLEKRIKIQKNYY